MFIGLQVTLAALFLLGSASAQCNVSVPNPMVKKGTINSRFEFALDSLKKMVDIDRTGNIFYSPYSLHQALMLAFYGSRGSTDTSLRKALHIPNDLTKDQLRDYYSLENLSRKPDLQNNGPADYEYESANRLWISDTRKLEECMLNVFNEQLERTDFRTNPSAVRDRINQWVSNVTRGHIRDLLSDDSISENTDLVLANAVYFKGLWLSRFDSANSENRLFYTSGSQHSTTTFMRQEGNFNYDKSESLRVHVLELPYKGEKVSMFVLLPPFANPENNNNEDSLRQLIERLSNQAGAEALRSLFDSGISSQQVEVMLPRWEMEKELPLGRLLHELGAGELMMPNKADLSGFLKAGEKPLHLGDAIHRAKIEVTEEGTTAAAATILYSFRSGRPLEPAVFNANHPFLYFIYDKSTQSILFTGVFRTPSPPKNNA
ncbi:serine protease inhibitor 88Ea isoform X2 [Megachile rotundata]|uniref:serine protease inhibitor 88Ea isoform X2 n=1 Tax=Megachile rotundata TaxID=143995 RepID=UPI003FD3E7F1